MPYTPQTWTDSPSTTTPLSAARLAHIEDGLDLAADVADGAQAGVSTHAGAGDPHPAYETSAEAQAKVDAHAGAVDPHAGYRLESVLLTAADVAAANKDGTAGTASLRTLGTGAQQAAAGPHGHGAITASPMAINARDYLNGDGVAETVAAINALKAALDGKIVHFPPAVDYNLANMLSTTGGTGFVFTKPTEFRGPGQGEDQAVGGQTVGRLIFPAGCHFIEIQGTGAGGGAAGSRLIDLFLKGPVGAGGSAEDFDGVRVRAYDFYARGVRVEGVGRDGWNFDTNASSNANMSLLETCSAWFCRRNGLYGVGTNTNVLNLQTFKANNNGAYTTTSGSHTLPVTTLNVASGGTRDFRTGGGPFTVTVGGVMYRGSHTGKSGNTLTGVTWPGAVSTLVFPAGSAISAGFGLYLGGAATPGTDPYGGATCTVTAFHGSFNAEGAIMDNGSSNLYQNPYEEATNATFPHSWRFVIGPDSVFGGLWAPKFGGYPVYNLSALATGTYSFDRKANDGWDIRQPVPYGFESTPRASGAMVIAGSKGGNAAMASVIAGLVNAGRAVDETT